MAVFSRPYLSLPGRRPNILGFDVMPGDFWGLRGVNPRILGRDGLMVIGDWRYGLSEAAMSAERQQWPTGYGRVLTLKRQHPQADQRRPLAASGRKQGDE